MRQARQNLSVYLARVKAGETFEVTEHGRVVATLGPPPRDDDPLAHLVAAGLLIPAVDPHSPLPDPIELPPGGPDSLTILDELRAERDL